MLIGRSRLVAAAAALSSSVCSMSSSAIAGRVLSIQSHVVHGAVGNRAAALPLQLLGVEVDVLNTVQYSNHVGYGSFAGEKLTGEQVWALLEGMQANGLLAPTRLLTGYMGSVDAVRAAARALPLLRQNQPNFQFWCDPVLGDNGRLYVPAALVDAYRDEIVPYADALLPNQFEAELLSGITIRTAADARRACDVLHGRGVKLVIITSLQLDAADADPSPPLSILFSRTPQGSLWRRVYRLDVPQLPANFAGTGDLLAALLLGWDIRPGVPAHTGLRRALAGVQAVLRRTMEEAGPARGEGEAKGLATRPLGLRILSSIDEIRHPDESSVPAPTRLDSPLRGVLFDMDGTLTLPSQLDFVRMRSAAGLPEGAPIFSSIEALPADRRAAAWAEIEKIELEATPQLQPGLATLFAALRTHGLRVGIATRNNPRAVDALVRAAGLPADTFDPVLTRESDFPDKPHPAIALAAAAAWELPPEACMFVGDSPDDMLCGRAAGMATCFLGDREAEADVAISSLDELTAMLDDAVQTE